MNRVYLSISVRKNINGTCAQRVSWSEELEVSKTNMKYQTCFESFITIQQGEQNCYNRDYFFYHMKNSFRDFIINMEMMRTF